MDRGVPAHSWSPVELKAQLDAARRTGSFIVYRSSDGQQQVIELGESQSHLTIGRGAGCDVCLDRDEHVSGLHAELLRIGPEWVVSDDGLSRNGSFLNGERIAGRRRLRDGDALRVGSTHMLYRAAMGSAVDTHEAQPMPVPAAISQTQRRILTALCRPFLHSGSLASAPTNRAIADEVGLSEDRVKAHLRALYELWGISSLSHNVKRVRLIELVLHSGLVSRSDLQ